MSDTVTRQPAHPGMPHAQGTDLPRMQLELAVEMAEAAACPLADKVAQAAQAAGADLLFMLPAPDGDGMSAVLHLIDGGADRFLQIRTAESGLVVSDAAEIDPNLLSLARTSVEVLQRIGADADIRGPLAAA